MKRRYEFANHFATPRDIPNFMPGFGIATMNKFAGILQYSKKRRIAMSAPWDVRPRKKTFVKREGS
jgi:hypothetical protein